MKKILNTEFKKHEIGPRQATLQQKALSSDAMQQQLSALPPRFFSIVTWNGNLRWGVAACLQWPLECPPPSC